jgi:hypothetical protein
VIWKRFSLKRVNRELAQGPIAPSENYPNAVPGE